MRDFSRRALLGWAIACAAVAFALGLSARTLLLEDTSLSPCKQEKTATEQTAPVSDRTEEPAARPKQTPAQTRIEELPPAPAQGTSEPLVTLLVCTSFPCSACSKAARESRPLIDSLKDRVRMEVRHSAPGIHEQARRSAVAALAAHRQERFFYMYYAMFGGQDRLTESGLRQHARRVGLNLEQFDSDMQDPALERQVAMETSLCRALGAIGTPAFFINGERHVGWSRLADFERVLRRHLEAAEDKLAAGVPREEIPERLARKYATDPDNYIALVLKHISLSP